MSAVTRERCILFADVVGSTHLYEKLGDEPAKIAVERCLNACRMSVEQFNGRVIKTIGDGLLAVFGDAEATSQAACQMQQSVHELPPVDGAAMSIRVGFHSGPVLEENDDVFGDTVNLAARLTGLARSGQIIASASTIATLSPLVRQAARSLEAMPVKGKSSEVAICEITWQDDGDRTMVAKQEKTPSTMVILYLRHNAHTHSFGSSDEPMSLGRDRHCAIVIEDPMASRQHARIECHGNKYVLIDSSTNGTWFSINGEDERVLRREEVVLRGTGRISFGHPWRKGGESVEFDAG